MNDIAKAKLAFTLETAYFGTETNMFNQERSVELGRCFADAIKIYDAGYEGVEKCKELGKAAAAL